jgi:CelD/BcsL family acetyltransferase involved in cellulose biosynthesis
VSQTFTTVRAASFDEVAEFGAEWDRLASLQRWPLAEFAWVRESAKHLCPGATLAIVLVCRGKALAAAVALATTPARVASLELIAASRLHEAAPILSDDPDALSRLTSELVAMGTPFALARILNPDYLEPHIRSASRGAGYVLKGQPNGAPYLDLPGTVEQFVKSLSSNRRSGLSRKQRKLEEAGTLKFSSSHPDCADVLAAIAEFERVEEQGWKGRQGSAITGRSGFHEFFVAALRGMARERRVRVDRLALDGETIAIQLGLVSHGRYFLIKPTFDERFGSLSPGYQLTYHAIKQSILAGMETYEFLGSEDDWKLHWTNTVRSTRTWVFYPYNVKGLARLGLDAVGAIGRRF